MSYYTSYYTTFLTYAWVHTLILLRFTILYMQHRIYVGGVRLAITEHLSLLEALGHCQQHIICLSLLIDIHQDQCDEDYDECDDNEYHCSIAWGPCNRWPSKFAAYNVSVVPACPFHHRLHSVNPCSWHQVCPTHHSLQHLQ